VPLVPPHAQLGYPPPVLGGVARLLTITEASLALKLSNNTIRRRLKSGELAGQRIQTPQGYSWRVLVSDAPPMANGVAHHVPDPTTPPAAESPPQDAPDVAPAAGTHGQVPPGEGLVARLEAEVRRLEDHNRDLRAALDDTRTELDARRQETRALLTLLAQSRQALPAAPEPDARPADADGADGGTTGDERVPAASSTGTTEQVDQWAPAQEIPVGTTLSWWRRLGRWLTG
jgi:hypothetical protein